MPPSTPSPSRGRNIRVLLIAELCNPDWSSIPLEGWSHSQALAAVADTHLVTHIRNRENLLRAGLVEGTDFTAIDSQAVERPLTNLIARLGASIQSGKGWTTQTAVSAFTYQWFERLVWRRFGAAIRAGKFDVVHRLTPLSPTIPSPIARKVRRAGIPFVIGPLNGGLPWPKEFSRLRVKEREFLSYLRDAYKLLPGFHATRRHASAIIVGSEATRDQLPAQYLPKTVYIAENAVDPARFNREITRAATRPLKVVFVGRLVPYKGADMLIEAAAPLVRDGRLEIVIIGDGPEMPAMRALVHKEGIEAQVTFSGWIRHQEVQERLVGSDVFGFPSVREFGGAVVLEAMAIGLVPVIVAYGGPGELVSPGTGIGIPLGAREDIVAAFRAALERLAADPSLIRPMGERARARVFRSFTWAAKADQVVEVYRWVLGQREKPDFGMPYTDPAVEDGAPPQENG